MLESPHVGVRGGQLAISVTRFMRNDPYRHAFRIDATP
jgi:hypothetical protein